MNCRYPCPISGTARADGSVWSIGKRFRLGLSGAEYLRFLAGNLVNLVLLAIMTVGLPVPADRYLHCLSAVTSGSNDYPWGLFLGFGLFGMVLLSASGYLLGTAITLFGREDFHPIERLAQLNGMPGRLVYPMFVSFDLAAVLFLVAWHVATYLSVQTAEMLPALFEWMGRPGWRRFITRISLGLTIAGIILSTLHQGALGALFTYAPTKIHPLWLSTEFQWIHFLCSAIFRGLAMVIVSSSLITRCLPWRYGPLFLDKVDGITLGLAKGAAYAMFTYLVIKLVALAHDSEWEQLLTGWCLYYLTEIGIGVVLPLVLFTKGYRDERVDLVRIGAWIIVFGIIWNRLNTAIFCFNYQ